MLLSLIGLWLWGDMSAQHSRGADSPRNVILIVADDV